MRSRAKRVSVINAMRVDEKSVSGGKVLQTCRQVQLFLSHLNIVVLVEDGRDVLSKLVSVTAVSSSSRITSIMLAVQYFCRQLVWHLPGLQVPGKAAILGADTVANFNHFGTLGGNLEFSVIAFIWGSIFVTFRPHLPFGMPFRRSREAIFFLVSAWHCSRVLLFYLFCRSWSVFRLRLFAVLVRCHPWKWVKCQFGTDVGIKCAFDKQSK